MEQFFPSEEPDWLANSRGKERGSRITTPLSPSPPPQPELLRAVLGNPQRLPGFEKNLKRDHGATEEEKMGKSLRLDTDS